MKSASSTPRGIRPRGSNAAIAMSPSDDDFSHHCWFTKETNSLMPSSAGKGEAIRGGSGASSSARSARAPRLTEVSALTSGRLVGGVSYSPRKESPKNVPSDTLVSKSSKQFANMSTSASVFGNRRRNREAEEAALLLQGRRAGGTDNLYYVIPSGPVKDQPVPDVATAPSMANAEGHDDSDVSLVEDLATATPNQEKLMRPIYLGPKASSASLQAARRGTRPSLDFTLKNLTGTGGSLPLSLEQTLAATAILSAKMHQAMSEAQLVANEGGARMRLSILNAIPNVMPTFAALQSLVRDTFNRMTLAEVAERESIVVAAQKELYLINEHEKAVAIREREGIAAELIYCAKTQKNVEYAILQLFELEHNQRKSFEIREERVRKTQIRLWKKMQTDVVIAEELVKLLALEDQRRFKFSELELKHRRRILQQVSEEVLNVRSVNPMGVCPFYDGDDCPFTPDEGAHGQCISHGHYRRLPTVLEARYQAITTRSPKAGRERQMALELHRSSIIGYNTKRRSVAEEEDGRDDMTKPIFVREVKHFHKLMKALDEDIVTSDNTKGTSLRTLLRHQ